MNRIRINAPAVVTSGKAFELELQVQTDGPGLSANLSVEPEGFFEIHPEELPLPNAPTPTKHTASLKITKHGQAGRSCKLTARLGGSVSSDKVNVE